MKAHIKKAAEEQARSLRRTAFVIRLVVLALLALAGAGVYAIYVAAKADGERIINSKP